MSLIYYWLKIMIGCILQEWRRNTYVAQNLEFDNSIDIQAFTCTTFREEKINKIELTCSHHQTQATALQHPPFSVPRVSGKAGLWGSEKTSQSKVNGNKKVENNYSTLETVMWDIQLVTSQSVKLLKQDHCKPHSRSLAYCKHPIICSHKYPF